MKNILIINANNEISQSYQEIIGFIKFENFKFEILNLINELNFIDENIESNLNMILKNHHKIDIIVNCIFDNNFNDKKFNNYIKNLAEYCKKNQIFLINYSYFQNHYNLDKNSLIIESENIIKNFAGDFLIFRIFDVYNTNLKYENFYTKIIELSKEQEEISYSKNSILHPTSANFIVNNTIRILIELTNDSQKYLENKNKIYRLSNNFICSEYEFAELILKFLKRSKEIIKLNKITTIESTGSNHNNFYFDEFPNYLIDKNLNKLNNKYLAIFAHFDKDNIIDDYVIYYLQQLKLIASSIIFVSDCDLKENETYKIKNICDNIIAKKHHEYDFGSYKRGIAYAKDQINQFDSIILANDSCYGPFYPFENIFLQMEFSSCDFWGLTTNQENYLPHLQSYFIVFNKKIINNLYFYDFFEKIKKEKSKKDIVEKYEIGLSTKFLNYEFKMDSYIKTIFERNPTINIRRFYKLYANILPLLKVSIGINNMNILIKIADNFDETYSRNLKKFIKKHISRIKQKKPRLAKFFKIFS